MDEQECGNELPQEEQPSGEDAKTVFTDMLQYSYERGWKRGYDRGYMACLDAVLQGLVQFGDSVEAEIEANKE